MVSSLQHIHSAVHTVEITEIYSHLIGKIFRQITYLVISLVKVLLSRNFYHKEHSVEICKFFPHDFFAKITSN